MKNISFFTDQPTGNLELPPEKKLDYRWTKCVENKKAPNPIRVKCLISLEPINGLEPLT